MSRTKIIVALLAVAVIFRFAVHAHNHPASKKLDLDIVYIGNSITYGAKLENPKQDAPPVIASEKLRKKAGINSVSFSNQGRGGFTTVDYLPKSESFAQVIQATRQLHSNPKHKLVFSIKLGTNDSAIEGPNGAPVSKQNYFQNMKEIVNALLQQFPNSKIILQQPIWYSENTWNRSKYLAEGLARLQSYFPELESLVDQFSEIHPHQVYLGDQMAYEYFRKNYLTDLTPENGLQGTFYLHPNKKGASVLGALWANAIYEVVK